MLVLGLLCFSMQSQAQWKSSISDTLIVYRTPFGARLYLGEIKLTREQGVLLMKENRSTSRSWKAGNVISTMGFVTAGAGLYLSYVSLKGETVTAPDFTGNLVTYKVRDQLSLAAGLVTFVVGASLIQVGVDKKIGVIRRFNTNQKGEKLEKVTLNFGLQDINRIGFRVKLP